MARRYLLVDDNAAFVENLAEILRDEGAEVAIAGSGGEALELVRGSRFDALITDMRMPGMNGAALVHEVRRVDAGLPAIIVSAYTSEAALLAALKEGLLAVLPKPVPIARLLQLAACARRGGIVALVEDDIAFADNLAEALRDRGFSAVVASSLAETDQLGEISPLVALIDLRLQGTAVGAALRQVHARFPALNIFIVAARSERGSVPPGLPVFAKPCDPAALLGAIERLYDEGAQSKQRPQAT